MTTPSPIHPFNSRSRLNKPPLANRVKLPNSNVLLYDHYGPVSRHNLDPLSSNASCDTTLDETASLSSREPYSMTSFNLSCCMEPIADNSECKSMTSLEGHENNEDNQTIMNSTLHQKKKSHVDETKYKTEMCKKWTENGQCPYGNKCRFAHGRHELNDKYLPNRSSYKSKKCNSFHFNTICPYGTRCLFAHEQRSLEELAKDAYYIKFMSCPDFLDNPIMKNKRRLPVFCSNAIKDQLHALPNQGYLAQSWKSLISGDESEEFKDFTNIFGKGKPSEGEESTL